MYEPNQKYGKNERIKRSQAVSNGLTSIDGRFEYMYDIHNVSKAIREKKFNTLAEVHHFMKQNKLWQDFGKGQEDDYWYLRDKAAEFEWEAHQKKSLVIAKQTFPVRTQIVYGVKMTSLENMAFSKYVSNNNIAMNTKIEKERTHITLNWLNNYKASKQPLQTFAVKHISAKTEGLGIVEDEIKQQVIKNYKPNIAYGETKYIDLHDKIKDLKFSSTSELIDFCLKNNILMKHVGKLHNVWNIEIDTYFFKVYFDELSKYEKKQLKNHNTRKSLPELDKYGLKIGDKVSYNQVDSFMNETEYNGIIYLRNGIPYIRLDYRVIMKRGNRSWTTGIIKWNKAWEKAEESLQQFAVKHIASQKEGLKGTEKLRLRYKKPTFKTTQDEQIFESELLEKIEHKIPLSYGEFLYATEEMYLPEHLQRDLKVKQEDMHKAIWSYGNGSFDKFVENTKPKEKEESYTNLFDNEFIDNWNDANKYNKFKVLKNYLHKKFYPEIIDCNTFHLGIKHPEKYIIAPNFGEWGNTYTNIAFSLVNSYQVENNLVPKIDTYNSVNIFDTDSSNEVKDKLNMYLDAIHYKIKKDIFNKAIEESKMSYKLASKIIRDTDDRFKSKHHLQTFAAQYIKYKLYSKLF